MDLMDSDYEQKYLKYKKKYLELKQLEKSLKNASINNMTGGYAYMAGKYVFFIPENDAGKVDLIGTDKVIKSLDKFTTSLGNCTRFVRIGFASVDPTHQYDTIYTNQSSLDVASRESNKAYQATKEAATNAYNVSKTAYGTASKEASKAYEASKEAAKNVYDVSKKAYGTASAEASKAYEASKAAYKAASDAYKSTPSNSKLTSQNGGDNNCDKLPIKLSDVGLKPIASLNDVNDTVVKDYVSKINEKQSDNKIGRVIVIEKTGTFGSVHLYQDFSVSYDGNNIQVTKK